ncbi:HAMP domain-containing histidine kinase [Akkermansiaceae bacterium]|nr:HAMP domain-containing histidine kinase [Akkermansiaceae bacterium]MDB4333559.1 HAMP domain-containing histidine kinase [Akkermansiaceae bacterium]
MKIPISFRILLLLLLNVALVAAILWWVASEKYDLGRDELVAGNAEGRVMAMSKLLDASLEPLDREDWTPVLEEYEQGYRVSLAIYRPFGESLMEGTEWEVSPDEEILFQGPGEGLRGPPSGGPGFENEWDLEGDFMPGPGGWPESPGRKVDFLGIVTKESGRVAGVRMRLQENSDERVKSLVLLTREEEGSALFFSWKPLFWALVAVLLITLLVWVPWIYRVTRRLGILTRGAESISKGDFVVAVETKRKDELGDLSRSLQKMAGKLDELVSGQKRFLGDIAHELCSPLVRIRMGLGVLEHQLEPGDVKKLETIGGEVEELSQLVNELLDFSKASLKPKNLTKKAIELEPFCSEVIGRERVGQEISLKVPASLSLTTNEDLLRRALSNIIRNAVRYAEGIELKVAEKGDVICFEVLDRGPGIPAEWLDQIFEPFTRPDTARTREAGGAGLGLAIAKTCIESLGGSISAKNRSEGGLIVVLEVPHS